MPLDSSHERVPPPQHLRHQTLGKRGGLSKAAAAAMSTMKFCQECDNVLYPKEDKEQKILLYACRNCDHQEVADNNIVFKMKIHQSITEHPQVAADPTLPRTKNVRCPNCDHREAAFYQATSEGEQGLALFFVCCNPSCYNKWRD